MNQAGPQDGEAYEAGEDDGPEEMEAGGFDSPEPADDAFAAPDAPDAQDGPDAPDSSDDEQ